MSFTVFCIKWFSDPHDWETVSDEAWEAETKSNTSIWTLQLFFPLHLRKRFTFVSGGFRGHTLSAALNYCFVRGVHILRKRLRGRKKNKRLDFLLTSHKNAASLSERLNPTNQDTAPPPSSSSSSSSILQSHKMCGKETPVPSASPSGEWNTKI